MVSMFLFRTPGRIQIEQSQFVWEKLKTREKYIYRYTVLHNIYIKNKKNVFHIILTNGI